MLSREPYYLDGSAAISPIDLALGWGPMFDEAVIQHVYISQSRRRYRWKPMGAFPIPRREIERHSANMHMIPANDEALHALVRVKKGDVVEIYGHLVYVSSPDGFTWQSSLIREDTADGACEVVLVDEIKVIEE